jgi:hypothetical protein
MDLVTAGGGSGLRGLMAAVLLAGAALLPAQTAEESAATVPGPLVTDRPTDSASPELVPRRTFQLELGYKFTRLDAPSGRTDTQEAPDLLARVGISERIEARLTATGWSFKNLETGQEDGFNDVSLGVKIALADERGKRPQMALLADVSLPAGQAGFTDDYVIPKVLLLANHTLGGRVALTWNLGPSFVTRKKNDVTQTDVTLNYAVALSGGVGGPFSLFGEVFGRLDFGQGLPDSHTIQVGTTVLLGRLWQVDVRGGIGMVDNVPDWLAGAGLAFRVPH